MTKPTWADVKKGDAVELAGRVWIVAKIKPAGKKATVKLERDGRTSKGKVRLKDPVVRKVGFARRAREERERRDALHDRNGAQNRWATDRELREAMTRPLPEGDFTKRKPPEKPTGGKWGKAKGDAEKVLASIGARLVGEAKDENAGYYVPPVDVSTVAAHLALFHGGIPEACDDEPKMLRAHEAQHAAAKKGEGALAVNHWHEERRP